MRNEALFRGSAEKVLWISYAGVGRGWLLPQVMMPGYRRPEPCSTDFRVERRSDDTLGPETARFLTCGGGKTLSLLPHHYSRKVLCVSVHSVEVWWRFGEGRPPCPPLARHQSGYYKPDSLSIDKESLIMKTFVSLFLLFSIVLFVGGGLWVDGSAPLQAAVPRETYAFVTAWGGTGSGDGQFRSPNSVAVDTSDFVYVVDADNARIQQFTSEGTFVTKWGSGGSAPGQFEEPFGVAVDNQGFVYVADGDNNRLKASEMLAKAEAMFVQKHEDVTKYNDKTDEQLVLEGIPEIMARDDLRPVVIKAFADFGYKLISNVLGYCFKSTCRIIKFCRKEKLH